MGDSPTTHGGVPPDGTALEPTLVRMFSGRGSLGTQRRRIPRGGLLLGREEAVFDDAFDDLQMSIRHAEIRMEDGKVLIRDQGSDTGTRLNGQMLVGGSATMAGVRRSVDAVAARKHTVVVTGETGTGKEVVSRLVHQRSGRTGPFVAVNCGTFTEGLLASDLFGHVRGAFTGAVADQQGLFRAARGGTLLLDEVAEIPLALQANLLRVLEMSEVRPVGGGRDVATDVRVIATSNRELVDLVQAGRFRADLYSRLAQWTIRLPALRERREDIPALISHLLERCDGAGRTLTPDFAEALLVHEWPLNVRGLLTVLSVAVVSAVGDVPLSRGSEVCRPHTMSM